MYDPFRTMAAAQPLPRQSMRQGTQSQPASTPQRTAQPSGGVTWNATLVGTTVRDISKAIADQFYSQRRQRPQAEAGDAFRVDDIMLNRVIGAETRKLRKPPSRLYRSVLIEAETDASRLSGLTQRMGSDSLAKAA
jgi:hypothetical protein